MVNTFQIIQEECTGLTTHMEEYKFSERTSHRPRGSTGGTEANTSITAIQFPNGKQPERHQQSSEFGGRGCIVL